jgi:hypothetical protein
MKSEFRQESDQQRRQDQSEDDLRSFKKSCAQTGGGKGQIEPKGRHF